MPPTARPRWFARLPPAARVGGFVVGLASVVGTGLTAWALLMGGSDDGISVRIDPLRLASGISQQEYLDGLRESVTPAAPIDPESLPPPVRAALAPGADATAEEDEADDAPAPTVTGAPPPEEIPVPTAPPPEDILPTTDGGVASDGTARTGTVGYFHVRTEGLAGEALYAVGIVLGSDPELPVPGIRPAVLRLRMTSSPDQVGGTIWLAHPDAAGAYSVRLTLYNAEGGRVGPHRTAAFTVPPGGPTDP